MANEQRADSRAICDAATKEWELSGDEENRIIYYVDGSDTAISVGNLFGGFAKEDAEFIVHARTALPAALDELDAKDAEITRLTALVKYAKEECPNGGNDGYITPRPCQCYLETTATDRDHWKARAEALEVAAYGVCELCVQRDEPIEGKNSPCYEYGVCFATNGYFPQCEHWQFDQARFSVEEAQT